MLLHLPIAILATLSPITISDTLPKFDIVKECRFEAESSNAFDRCSRDEADALQKLEVEWPEFAGPDRSSCFSEATIGGSASYVELMICLEMARDIGNDRTNLRSAPTMPSTRPAPPELSIVDKHD